MTETRRTMYLAILVTTRITRQMMRGETRLMDTLQNQRQGAMPLLRPPFPPPPVMKSLFSESLNMECLLRHLRDGKALLRNVAAMSVKAQNTPDAQARHLLSRQLRSNLWQPLTGIMHPRSGKLVFGRSLLTVQKDALEYKCAGSCVVGIQNVGFESHVSLEVAAFDRYDLQS